MVVIVCVVLLGIGLTALVAAGLRFAAAGRELRSDSGVPLVMPRDAGYGAAGRQLRRAERERLPVRVPPRAPGDAVPGAPATVVRIDGRRFIDAA